MFTVPVEGDENCVDVAPCSDEDVFLRSGTEVLNMLSFKLAKLVFKSDLVVK
jgi:hypothetical protein